MNDWSNTIETIFRAVDYIRGTDGTSDLLPSESARLMTATHLLERALVDLREDGQDAPEGKPLSEILALVVKRYRVTTLRGLVIPLAATSEDDARAQVAELTGAKVIKVECLD